jgi:DNA-binding NtrC family response regulator
MKTRGLAPLHRARPTGGGRPADARSDLELAARSLARVLISDGDGARRHRYARLIHDHSPSRREPYVAVSCRSLGILDGDASSDLRCLVHSAEGGTVFLDDIADLSPQLQAQLFDFLEQASFRRALARHPRLITGAQSPLRQKTDHRAFDEALFYRLNVIHLGEDAD